MFKLLKKNEVLEWPAVATLPVDGGKTKEEHFAVDLVILDTDELHQSMREGDEVLLKKVLTGWHKLGDKDGEELAFSQENLSAAAKNPYFSRAVVSAYLKASSGLAAEKNS